MSNIINDILHQYKEKASCADKVLVVKEIIPDTSHQSLPLPILQETILKMTYLYRVGFLEDMVLALQIYTCKQQIEKAVLELERKHYITSNVSSLLGKYFVLTKEALFFFYYHHDHTNPKKKINEVALKDDTLPNEDSLMKYKCVSAYSCFHIFHTQLTIIYDQFKHQSKEERQQYCKEQFVRHIIYKEFLSYSETKKLELLATLALEKDTIDKYSKINLYSKTFAVAFSDAYLKNECYQNELDISKEFQDFRLAINQLSKQKHSQQELFHFLKDYANLLEKPDLSEIIQPLLSQCHNMFRGNDLRMRNQLLRMNLPNVRKECHLFMLNEQRRILAIQRKVLLRKGAEKDLIEAKLQEANTQLKQIDHTIATLEEEISSLSTSFVFLLYKAEKESGALEFFEKHLDLNTLKQSNIHISIQGKDITFFVLAPNREAFTSIELFQRLERAYKIHQYLFPLFLPSFVIITYGKEQKHQTEVALTKTKSSFQDIHDYRILSLWLDTNSSVIDIEFHPTERFEFFQQFTKK